MRKTIEELESELLSASSQEEAIDITNEMAELWSNKSISRAEEMAKENLRKAEILCYRLGIARANIVLAVIFGKLSRRNEALQYGHTALGMLEEMQDHKAIARTLGLIGTIHAFSGNSTEGLRYMLEAEQLFLEIGSKEMYPIYGNIGTAYESLGNVHLAIEYHKKSLENAQIYADKPHLAIAMNNIGISYQNLGDYTQAIEWYFQSLAISREIGNDYITSLALINLGVMYHRLDNFTSALDYYFQALRLTESMNNIRDMAHCLVNIALSYQLLNDRTNALNYYLRALRLAESTGNSEHETSALLGVGFIFEQLGEQEKAMQYYRKSLQIISGLGNKSQEIQTLLSMGQMFLQAKNTSDSRPFFEKALFLADSITSPEWTSVAHRFLSEVYRLEGDTMSSAEHFKLFRQLSEEFFSEKESAKARKLILEFELNKSMLEAAHTGISSDEFSIAADALLRADTSPAPTSHQMPRRIGNIKTNFHNEIRVQTFGHFALYIDNKEISHETWQRKKARDVFKVLLLHYRKAVTADELIELVWGENAAGKKNLPALFNATSCIRKALEPDLKPQMPSSYLKVQDNTYLLDLGENADIDFIKFRKYIARARKENSKDSKVDLYEKALKLYIGDFLKEDVFEEWSEYERESLKEMYLEILLDLGIIYEKNNDFKKSWEYGNKILEIDRVNEEAYLLIFRGLCSMEQQAEIRKIWKQCRTAFKKELDCEPPIQIKRIIVDFL